MLGILASLVLVVFLLVVVLLNVPQVQDLAKDMGLKYLNKKLGDRVELRHLAINFPTSVSIDSLYVEDASRDTLTFLDHLYVKIDMWGLLSGSVHVDSVYIHNFYANVHRTLPDTTFNYNYIIEAFASEPEEEKEEDTTSSMDISLGSIELSDIRLYYNDVVSGYKADVNLGDFKTRFDSLNLDQMRFGLDSILLDSSQVNFVMNQPLTPQKNKTTEEDKEEDKEESPMPEMNITGLFLENVQLHYLDKVNEMKGLVDLDSLFLIPEKIDFNQQQIHLRKFLLNRSTLAFSMKSKPAAEEKEEKPQKEEEKEPGSTTDKGWMVTLDSLELVENHLKYNDEGRPKQPKGMDFNHIDVKDLVLLASNIIYTPDSSYLFLKNLSFKEQSGFALRRLTTNAIYTNHGAQLDKLLLRTNNSRIGKDIKITYPSLDALSETPGELGMNIFIDSAVIGMKDLYYFQPDLATNEYMKGLTGNPIFLHGQLNGKLKNLHIDSFLMKLADETSLALKGNLKNILDPDQSYFDVDLQKLASGRKDIQALLPKNLLPSDIGIPQKFALDGGYKGSLNSFRTDLHLKSSDGKAVVKAAIKDLSDSIHANYKATVALDKIRLDRILKNDTLYGPVSMNMGVTGEGLSLSSMKAALKGNIQQATYNGYDYRNLQLKGAVDHEVGHLQAEMDDPNARFSLMTSANLSDSIPSVKAEFNLDNLDLQKLHLLTDQLVLKGQMTADFDQLDVDQLNGNLALRNWSIINKGQKIDIDSVTLAANHTGENNDLKLRSPFATADVEGNYKLSELGTFFQRLQTKYMGADSVVNEDKEDSLSSWEMKLNMKVLPSSLLEKMVPDLTQFQGGQIKGYLSSKPDTVELQTTIPPLTYNGFSLDSVLLNIFPKQKGLHYGLTVHHLHDSSTINIPHLNLNGQLNKGEIGVHLRTQDEEQKDRFRISGNLQMQDSSYRFSLLKDSLLLDYLSWTIPEDNYIRYSPDGLTIHHLKLQQGQDYIEANSDTTAEGQPLNVAFNHFDITTLTSLFLSDSMQVGGLINGKATLENLMTEPLFVTDMSLDSLSFNGVDVGTLAVKADNKKKDTYHLDTRLTGNDNDLKIIGDYLTSDSGSFDFNVDMNALSMATIQAFSFGQLSHSSGKMTGDLQVSGTTEAPRVDGKITFDDAAFKVAQLNEMLKLKEEDILFNPTGIHFNNFTILNGNDDKAVIDGDVLTQKYQHFKFNLNLLADKFRALNIPEGKDKPFYGKLFVSTKTKITGDEKLPKIDMQLGLNDGTDFTYVMLDENPEEESSEGIVQFFDPDKQVDTLQMNISDSARYSKTLEGLDIDATIHIDTNALFNVVIDPVSGDNLFVRGKADLDFTMDPGGKMSLTGRYDLIHGTYNLSLEGVIKKKFDLLRGSSINWKGDPMSADMNITAEYNTEASPLELVQGQMDNDNDEASQAYKQKLPFQVFLHLNGELLKPDISFELGMPEEARQALNGAVYTRINQINTNPSEVNKQTLGLLVLNHFIGDNPLKTSAGGSTGDMVRKSANKLLSQQLNKLAGNLINGVDVNLALEDSKDYSSSDSKSQTNLNVGLSKSLFNDRTTVYVGGDIPLEGQGGNQKASQIVGDVALEYKLTKDGRYRVRAYRKNKYQGVIEGEFVETGLSFIVMMNYNKFKELFKSTKTLEKEQKEEEGK